MQCTSRDLELFGWNIMLIFRPYLPSVYPGGSFMDLLMDMDYSPSNVIGRSYYPSPGDSWSAFTCADQSSVDRFAHRQKVLNQHVADILLNFTEPTYWKPKLDAVADQTDGQLMLYTLSRHFYEDSLVGLNARADKFRKANYKITGAEDPTTKVGEIMTGWNDLRTTQAGISQFPVSWLALTVSMMVEYNDHYSIWREAGGLNNLLASQNPSAISSIFPELWADSHAVWERKDRAAAKLKAQMANASSGGRGAARASAATTDRSGGRDLSKVKCYNCQQMGHYASNCPRKGGAGPSKVRKAGRNGSWTRSPCVFKDCKGDRKTHSANDCPSKLAADKKSRAGRANKNTGRKRQRRARVSFADESAEESESDSDRTVVIAKRARISAKNKRRNQNNTTRPAPIGRLARMKLQDDSESESEEE